MKRTTQPRFSLTLYLGNDGCRTPDHVAWLLRDAARRLVNGETDGKLWDDNGNTVGSFSLPALPATEGDR